MRNQVRCDDRNHLREFVIIVRYAGQNGSEVSSRPISSVLSGIEMSVFGRVFEAGSMGKSNELGDEEPTQEIAGLPAGLQHLGQSP